jgi:acetoin utilization deacetylase AcuC-like enzyme
MATLLVAHPAGLNHLTPPGHPERPDRLRAITRVLDHDRFKDLIRAEAPAAPAETIALCHPLEHVERIREIAPKEGMVRLDADTAMSAGSFEAAIRAVGGAVLAIDEVLAKRAGNAFCAMRPPGHHAETTTPMGFCIFNHAAVAARYAQKQHGLGRVAVVDFDVHHGNGTQAIFWSDPSVMYCSTHEMPLYPGTGAANETGAHDNIVNAPLRAGDGGDRFRAAFERTILPRLRAFGPELIVVSAGFDAHRRDPLANLNLTEADFAWVTQEIMSVAEATADGRLVSVLEGGYDLEGLAGSVAAHVDVLMRG